MKEVPIFPPDEGQEEVKQPTYFFDEDQDSRDREPIPVLTLLQLLLAQNGAGPED